MRLNPRLLRDTLTVEAFNPGPLDPLTGVPTGPGSSRLLLTQPGSDQDVLPSKRFRLEINSGVQGAPPVSLFYTAYFRLDLQPGETPVYKVNGRTRPLMRQGPPQDAGGQHQIMVLELGAPLS